MAASTAFCQHDSLTKILLKVKANCNCYVQLARNRTPSGKAIKMISDTLLIAVEKEVTGFFMHCGESNVEYIEIPYKPGQGYLRIRREDGL